MENLIVDAVQNLVVQSPVVAVIGLIAWQLRADLKECIGHSQSVIDRLLSKKED